MKKTAVILTMVAVLSSVLAGCGAKSPYELWRGAVEPVRSAAYVEAKTDLTMESTYKDEKNKATASLNLQQSRDGAILIALSGSVAVSAEDDAQELKFYYQDGKLYCDDQRLDFKFCDRVSEQAARAQLGAAELDFAEDAVRQSSAEKDGDGQTLKFTLSPEAVQEDLKLITLGAMNSMGALIDMDAFEGSTFVFSQVETSFMLDKKERLTGCLLDYTMDVDEEGANDPLQLHYRVETSGLKLDGSGPVKLPDDLETYDDLSPEAMQEQLDKATAELEALEEGLNSGYVPVKSDYQVVNSVGDNCYAALFLEDNRDRLDYYFWLAYQTQAGYTAPANPTGFASAADISSEGLVRLFCFLNQYQLAAFSDPAEEKYYMPIEILPMTLDKHLEGYSYDPATLPAEYGDGSFMLNMTYDDVKAAGNACRIEKVEVTSADHLKITATGLAADRETPVNTQVLVLKVRDGGGAYFESYSIN